MRDHASSALLALIITISILAIIASAFTPRHIQPPQPAPVPQSADVSPVPIHIYDHDVKG